MPPVRITSPQRLLSAAINAANSSGLPSGSCSPCLLKRSRTSGTSNALRVSALSQSTVARGVPAGAMSPNQAPPWSAAKPTSAEVGTSGSTGFRCGDNTASARTCPDRDRKSTRLNSSHLGISYAVFCVKKKKEGGTGAGADYMHQVSGGHVERLDERIRDANLGMVLVVMVARHPRAVGGETGAPSNGAS